MNNKRNFPVSTPVKPRSEDRFTKGTTLAGPSGPEARTRPEAAWTGLTLAWNNFWFQAVDPLALHAIRILGGLLLLSWLLPFAGQIEAMFTLGGWIDRNALIAFSRPSAEPHPLPNWSLLYLCNGVGSASGLYWATIVVIGLFTLGLATRITSILTWLLIASFVNFLSRGLGTCENDLLIVLAFYLMVAYVLLGQFNRKLSLPARILGSWDTFVLYGLFPRQGDKETGETKDEGGRRKEENIGTGSSFILHPSSFSLSYAANLALRLFQVNFALFMVVNCLTKLQIGDWWSGVAIWYPLHNPFETTPDIIRWEADLVIPRLVIYTFAAYLLMAWQLTFPLWAWRPRLRLLLLGGGGVAWVGTIWIYHNPMLGLFYFVGCLSFVSSEEWRRLGDWLGRVKTGILSARAKTQGSTLRNILAFLALSGATCAPQAPQDTPLRPVGSEPDERSDRVEERVAPNAPKPIEPLIASNQPLEAETVSPILKARIDAAVEHIRKREIYTSYGFWTVLHAILGLGPDNAYLVDQTDSKSGNKIKAFDYICEGRDMIGLKFIEHKDKSVEVLTRSGDGFFQGHQDQFIAEIAQWDVPKNRIFKVNGNNHTFDDFVRSCKNRINLHSGQELSWALLIIGQYYGTDWKNESLSMEDLVRYEIRNPIDKNSICGGTHRLFDLTWVYYRHRERGGKKDGVWVDVVKDLVKYKDLAKKFQNGDGTFSTKFLIEHGTNPDPNEQIRTTGHILEWLSLYLSDKELKEPWMQNAANALSLLILNNRSIPLDGGSVYHAVHGLQIYRSRVSSISPFLVASAVGLSGSSLADGPFLTPAALIAGGAEFGMSWIPTPPRD